MAFYTRALIIPAFFGLVVFVLGKVRPEMPTTAIYSIFISIWATVYLELWRRQEAEQAYKWDASEGTKGPAQAELSQQFVKQMRKMYMGKETAARNLRNLQKVLKGVDPVTIQRDIEGAFFSLPVPLPRSSLSTRVAVRVV